MSGMLRLLENLRKKKAQNLCSLTFLLRRCDTGTVPKLLKVRRVFHSAQANRIYHRMEQTMLSERIHQTRLELAVISSQQLNLHLLITNEMQLCEWNKVGRLTFRSMELNAEMSCNRTTRSSII